MRIDILTLFPGYFHGPFDASIIKRAREAGTVTLAIHNIRDWAEGRHAVVDDYPYGGGAGMVMKPEPLAAAMEAVQAMASPGGTRVLLTPQGSPFNQAIAEDLAKNDRLVLVCGHYEGVDERFRSHFIDREISLGDFVLSGGEAAAIPIVDAVLRLIPGVVGSSLSLEEESFAEDLLEYPQYTRPPDFRGWKVPEILLSGNHQKIALWRRQQRILRTAVRRPDLLERAPLSERERRWIESEMAAATGAQEE